jgi:hypothetical protein
LVKDTEEDDDVVWPITDEMKQSMNNSLWLRKELLDGGLRQIIAEIDSSGKKQLLHKAICENVNFRKYIDQLLVTTGVLKKIDDTSLLVLDVPYPATQEQLTKDSTALVHPDDEHNNNKCNSDNDITSDSVNSATSVEEEEEESDDRSNTSSSSDSEESSDENSTGTSTDGCK